MYGMKGVLYKYGIIIKQDLHISIIIKQDLQTNISPGVK